MTWTLHPSTPMTLRQDDGNLPLAESIASPVSFGELSTPSSAQETSRGNGNWSRVAAPAAYYVIGINRPADQRRPPRWLCSRQMPSFHDQMLSFDDRRIASTARYVYCSYCSWYYLVSVATLSICSLFNHLKAATATIAAHMRAATQAQPVSNNNRDMAW